MATKDEIIATLQARVAELEAIVNPTPKFADLKTEKALVDFAGDQNEHIRQLVVVLNGMGLERVKGIFDRLADMPDVPAGSFLFGLQAAVRA